MPISLAEKLKKELFEESEPVTTSPSDFIRLYHEGLFYSCYESSAIKLKLLLPQLQLLQQRRKGGSSYFRIGVVQTSSLLQTLPVSIMDEEGNYKDYLEFHSGVHLDRPLSDFVPDKTVGHKSKEVENKTVATQGKSTSAKTEESENLHPTSAEERILRSLKTVNTGRLTPVQALQLVDEWQRLLLGEA